MHTITTILQEAGPLALGSHIYVENPPWMSLHIELTRIPGPHGLRSISVAHYGHQNGDAMRDPESGKRAPLLTLPPLRTVHAGFLAYGSSHL